MAAGNRMIYFETRFLPLFFLLAGTIACSSQAGTPAGTEGVTTGKSKCVSVYPPIPPQ